MRKYRIQVKGKEYNVYVDEIDARRFRVALDDKVAEVELVEEQDIADAATTPGITLLEPDEEGLPGRPAASRRHPQSEGPEYAHGPSSTPRSPGPVAPTEVLRGEITAPMPGLIQEIQVKAGDRVENGQPLLVLEAMKMKNSIRSPRVGIISRVRVQSGQSVSYGDVLVEFEEEGKP